MSSEPRYRWWFAWYPVWPCANWGKFYWLRWVQRARYNWGWNYRLEDFTCRVCGGEVISKPPDAQGICPDCCEHPDHEYERGMGELCTGCGERWNDLFPDARG